jgi:S-formylglutathione hydrolase FrmB
MKHSLILVFLFLLFSIKGNSQTVQFSDYEPTVYKGSTVVEQVHSPGLEGNLLGDPSTQPLTLYLPPGYDFYPNNNYPVVYLLHGYTQDYNTYYGSGSLLGHLNDMISQKNIIPMIIVTPNGKNKYDGSWYTNSYVSGNWEDYIVEDVLQAVESKYQVLAYSEARGLTGFSMGGYGTVMIAMEYPSVYSSIALMGAAALDLEVTVIQGDGLNKENLIAAAGKNKYRSSDPWGIRVCFAKAVASAPDSTAVPVMGRLPYTADGDRIDSTWQKWLEQDPFKMLPAYKDSLLKLDAIQIFIGDADKTLAHNESYHQALLDQGIEHGYEVIEGRGHSPVWKKMLRFFSENLVGVVPTVHSFSDYYLESSDTLVAEMDMDGKLYIVPFSAGTAPDSIYKYQVETIDALANVENEIQLSGYQFGKYCVFAISSDSGISNIPEEICVVPYKSPPILSLVSDSVNLGDSIRVSISRDGLISLHSYPVFFYDRLKTASEILNSSRLIESTDALADELISFSTDGLSTTSYWIYGFDQYGIVTGPISVDLVTSLSGTVTNRTTEVMFFPNPVKEMVTIQTSIPTTYELAITNINGQLLYRDKMEGPTRQIDLSSFEKGIYFIKIRSRDYVRTEKVIKQ